MMLVGEENSLTTMTNTMVGNTGIPKFLKITTRDNNILHDKLTDMNTHEVNRLMSRLNGFAL